MASPACRKTPSGVLPEGKVPSWLFFIPIFSANFVLPSLNISADKKALQLQGFLVQSFTQIKSS